MKLHPCYRAFLPAAFLGLAILTASAAVDRAQAFTFEQGADTAPTGGAANIADPDERLNPRSNGGSQSTFQDGNTTIRFGAQPQQFDQRYNGSDYFDSSKLMGR